MLPRFILLIVTALLVANAGAADSNAEKVRKLTDILQSNASIFDKARACQQLGEIGNREAVPALAALLNDQYLSAYARSGLEGIPDPTAAEALRTAAPLLNGNQLAGVINSLGVLRDSKAISLLCKLANDQAAGVHAEALLALGRIASQESLEFLRQILAKGPEQLRSHAAAACLLAAEKQMADGQADTAVTLYDEVRTANLPVVYRSAATRGAIVARNTNGVPLLIEQLRSSDRIIRNAALTAIREIPSEVLARALNNELNWASVELQIQLLTALEDCHNSQSLRVLQSKANSDEAEVRATALAVLSRIGGASGAGVLLQAVAENRSAEESTIALRGLERMEGGAIDRQILQAMTATTEAGYRIKIIHLVESRGMTNAAGELLKQAADPEVKVSVAALSALKSLGSLEELPTLLALTKAARDPAVREAAESAVVGLCTLQGNMSAGGEATLAELKEAADPALKNSWIRILVSLGYSKALPAMLATLHDPDEAVAANAAEQLARWPDPTPVEDLFAVAHAGRDSVRSRRALLSIIQLTTLAADERQRPDEVIVQWFQRASQEARTPEERRLIISGLGRVKHLESFRLLVPYLDDPTLRNEASVAVLQIAPAVRQNDPAALRKALEKIATTVDNSDIRDRAAKLAGVMPSEAKTVPLFDGQSLAGWEGDTNVWRVRDAVIVGGSFKGNPRNEFLASIRSYTNFILRLEYKLVGTSGFINSGVQFRSLRIKQPPNEMTGFQADIGAGYSGFLYDESRRNRVLAHPTEEQIKGVEKPGDWNHYEVRCAGPRIQIVLNGVKTVDYTETDQTIPLIGLLGLQIHGGSTAEVYFRNLAIEELSYGSDVFGNPSGQTK